MKEIWRGCGTVGVYIALSLLSPQKKSIWEIESPRGHLFVHNNGTNAPRTTRLQFLAVRHNFWLSIEFSILWLFTGSAFLFFGCPTAFWLSKASEQPLFPVFELRKNKWLFHGQPGYNFWSQCPSKFLVVLTWNKVNNSGSSVTAGAWKFMVVRRTTTSVFLVVRRLFWLSRAHGQPKFRTLVISIET